jgi:hypothetical protein
MDEVNSIFEKAQSKSSKSELSLNISTNFDELSQSDFDVSKFNLSMSNVFLKDTNSSSTEFNLNYEDNELFQIKCISDDEYVGITSDEVSEKYLVTKKENLATTLKKIATREDEDSDLLDMSIADDEDTVSSFFNNNLSILEKNDLTDDERKTLISDYANTVYNSLNEEQFTNTENVMIKLSDGNSIQTSAYSLAIKNSEIINIYSDILKKLRNDENLLSKIVKEDEDLLSSNGSSKNNASTNTSSLNSSSTSTSNTNSTSNKNNTNTIIEDSNTVENESAINDITAADTQMDLTMMRSQATFGNIATNEITNAANTISDTNTANRTESTNVASTTSDTSVANRTDSTNVTHTISDTNTANRTDNTNVVPTTYDTNTTYNTNRTNTTNNTYVSNTLSSTNTVDSEDDFSAFDDFSDFEESEDYENIDLQIFASIIFGYKINYTLEEAQDLLDKELEKIANADIDETVNQITIYVADDVIRKLTIKSDEVNVEVEFTTDGNKDSIKFTILQSDETANVFNNALLSQHSGENILSEDDSDLDEQNESETSSSSSLNNGYTFKVEKTKTDTTTKMSFEIDFIEDLAINKKLTLSLNTKGTTSLSTLINNEAIITYTNEEGQFTATVNYDINFDLSSADIPQINEDTSIFMDKLSDDEFNSVMDQIEENIGIILVQKMLSLNLIDINSNSSIVESNTDSSMDGIVSKEDAKNKLIEAVSNEMGIAISNGEEYTLENLQTLEVPGYYVMVRINGDIARVSLNTFVFYIDSNFNLSEAY